MKKSKRVISLLLSVLMLVSVFQVGFTAFAADGTNNGAALSATEAAILPDAGAVTTSSDVVRVASGLYSYETGTTIVPATESGIPAVNGNFEENSLANTGSINETPSYPYVKIVFDELPSDVPQIKCINTKSGTSNVVMSSAIANDAEKSYTWFIASGTANAGDTLQYEITYTYNSKKYVSYAYSYVESIAQPAGSYVSTKARFKDWLDWGNTHYAGVSAATRLLGKNVYGSLEDFTISTSELRGYYNASFNSYVMRSSSEYSSYGISQTQETTSRNETRRFSLNSKRSYADIYIDTSVVKSYADLNLRYAITDAEKVGDNTMQTLNYVAAIEGKANASSSYEGTGDYALGTKSSVGGMNVVGNGVSQYVTTFDGSTFIDGAEYTLAVGMSSSDSGAVNETYFPLGIRIHTVDKAELRALINDILHNNTPETPLVTANNKGVNPQSWYYSAGFSAYQTAMINAQTVLNNPRSKQAQINDAVSSLSAAYSGLVLKGADYSVVEDAIDATAEYLAKENLYTPESIADLKRAISIYTANENPDGTIQYGYSVLFQPQVDKWASDIYSAIKNLEYRLADYEKLDEAYAKAEAAEDNIDMYLDFSNVKAAMNNILWDIKIIEQPKVDAMTEALNEALKNLKFKPADYTAVNKAVNNAQAYVASNYTEESYAELRALLRSIDYTLTVDKQDVVNNYVTQINDAIENLEELPADYAELEALLYQINHLVEAHYYPETYKAAKDAAAECEGYKTIGITRQAEIDAMRDSLQIAVDGLVMYNADYSAVESEIKRFNNMDLNQITPDSITRVEDAIDAVEYGLKINKQSVVDNYALLIKNAIDSLSYKPADYTQVTLAVERAKALVRTDWADMSAVDAAVEAVEYGFGVNRQSEVNAMAAAINDAIAQLQPGPADYSSVRAQIARFEALNPNYYTETSMNNVRTVIESINWNLTVKEATIVMGYALAIADAMLDLEEAPADYEELNRISDSIPLDLESQYTAESIRALREVYNSINWKLKARDQQIVVGYQDALNKAILELKYLTGDYSEVDKAIAEGRAIIAKNDPPISQESIDSFEALVAGIDRTYTIKQTVEIATLASQIRAAYAVFTYAESIHKASISLVADRTASYPGDIITVSVIVGTDYYAASSSIPVLYDSNFYTLVGTSVADAFAFEGSYAEGSIQSGSITSPDKGYPASYTAAAKAQWKYALITLAPFSSLNPNAQILSPAQTVVKLQFRVNDMSVSTGSSFTAKIWIDPLFKKTEDNRNGRLYIGRFENETVNNDVITVGQAIDLSKADINISIINPDSPAVFTYLKAALIQTPAHPSSYYTEESYKAYADAFAVGQEVVAHEGEYTVMEQPIIDNATNDINEAFAALKLKGATTDSLIAALGLTPEHTSDYYTVETYSNFTSAVAAGQAILKETNLTILDNFRIDAAASAITSAYSALKLKPFSYTASMEDALSKIPEYDESYYSDDTYEAYANAYAALEAFKEKQPTFLDDEEGMDLIFDLNQAFNALYLLDADTSVLEEAINAPLDYDASFYTDETYADYEAAIKAGNDLLKSEERLTMADSERIQAAADDITAAIELLEFKPFSYQEQIDEALGNWFYEGADDEYTPESVENFWMAFDELAGFWPVDIRDDAEAERLLANLKYALENMKYVGADLTLLEEALALEALDESYYDSTTYQAYKDAIAEVEAYGEDYYWTLAEQDTVDELAQAIIDAYNALELLPFAMVDELEAAIEVTPEYDESYYQDEVYAEYEAALKVIEDMIADVDNLTILDHPEAEEAIENYNAALEALKSAWAEANYSDVEAAIKEAGEFDRDIYVNYEIVDEAISNVVYDLTILEQERVNGFAAAIREAYGKLIEKDGDYTPVEEAIERYEAKKAEMSETGIEIDSETIAAVEAAIEAVVDSLKITQQAQIQAYADAIDEAVKNLDYVSTILLKEDSAAYVTEEGYIRGLRNIWSEDEITENFDAYGKNTRIVVTPTFMGYGTGTLVQHFDGEELVEEFIVIVDGDINGDAFVDAFDVGITAEYINTFMEPANVYEKVAIDLCEDGWLDAIDLTIVINMANMAI